MVLIATGALLAIGTLLTWAELGCGVATRITQLLLLTAAAGYLLAGARPGDVGVALVTVVGNLALVVAAARAEIGGTRARCARRAWCSAAPGWPGYCC